MCTQIKISLEHFLRLTVTSFHFSFTLNLQLPASCSIRMICTFLFSHTYKNEKVQEINIQSLKQCFCATLRTMTNVCSILL